MKPRTKNITKGAGRELKGQVKKAAGRLTGNRSLEAKGRLQSVAGRAQRKAGKAQRKAEKKLQGHAG